MLNFIAAIGSAAAGGATAFESIATVTLAVDTATVSFTSIPSTYQHLQLRLIGRGNRAATVSTLRATVNSDTGTNYAQHNLIGDGATATVGGAASGSNFDIAKVSGATATASVFGVAIVDFHDYASTTKNKTIRTMAGVDLNGSGEIQLRSALWMNSSAINRIDIVNQTSNIIAGSTFALYGIKGA